MTCTKYYCTTRSVLRSFFDIETTRNPVIDHGGKKKNKKKKPVNRYWYVSIRRHLFHLYVRVGFLNRYFFSTIIQVISEHISRLVWDLYRYSFIYIYIKHNVSSAAYRYGFTMYLDTDDLVTSSIVAVGITIVVFILSVKVFRCLFPDDGVTKKSLSSHAWVEKPTYITSVSHPVTGLLHALRFDKNQSITYRIQMPVLCVKH